jgi:hypothetical protein
VAVAPSPIPAVKASLAAGLLLQFGTIRFYARCLKSPELARFGPLDVRSTVPAVVEET